MFIQFYNSVCGEILLESDGESLTGLWFDKSKEFETKSRAGTLKSLPIFDQTKQWLDLYLKGEQPAFTPKFVFTNLTPFRKQVYQILQTIPYGKTISYGQIAKTIAKNCGKAKISAQAVGGAVGANPICIIVPCHRVVGADGNLVGYGGGIENKIKLLEIEQVDMSKFYLPKRKQQVKNDCSTTATKVSKNIAN